MGCDSVFLSEFDDPSDRCERLGDAVDVPNAFFCSFESSYDRFRADACDLGANVIRYRIVSPCQSVRAEYFSCPVGADSADRAAEGATMAVDEGGGPE